MDPQTICPKDLIAIKESPATHREVLHFIPEDLHLEDTHMADQDKFRSSGEQTGSTFEEPWPELFDELFAHSGKCYTQLGSEVEALRLCHIVGLERILGCIEKIQTDEEQKQGDSCLFTTKPPPLGIRLQTRLIELYFRQFHPICPAVDERKFLNWYDSSRETKATQSRSMQLLLYCVLFAGSSYLERDELQYEEYMTVTQLQKALFSFAQAQYHLLEQEKLGQEALIQAALLLSYWSPYDGTREVNGFWSNEATRHAVAGGLPGSRSKSRGRVIWWCCIMRNRMISTGLRRPTLLRDQINSRLPEIQDFGEEMTHPRFVSKQAKVYFARAFHLLCVLTSTIAECVQLQHRVYTEAWELPAVNPSAQLLKEVRTLEDELTVWNVNFAQLYANVRDMEAPRTDLVIFHLLGLMHQFGLSLLYEPFLSTSRCKSPEAWLVRDHAFLKINQVSTTTASITASLLQHAQPKDIPIILLPWIVLPLALHLVQLGEPQPFDNKSEVVQRLGYLMRILHHLQARYDGAQFVKRIIDAIILFVRKHNTGRPTSSSFKSPSADSFRKEDLISQVLDVIKHGLAAEVILD